MSGLVIVDYGMGNLQSVRQAFEALGAPAAISADPATAAAADRLVLPGVGAWDDALDELARRGLIEPLRAALAADRPFLGICLGMQLLFEASDEGTRPGLAALAGRVRRFPDRAGLKVPHMGWNDVRVRRDCPLFAGLPEAPYFYFVHSYCAVPAEPAQASAWADYGGEFCAAVRRGRVHAVQFHPEKSHDAGLRVLRNFLVV